MEKDIIRSILKDISYILLDLYGNHMVTNSGFK